MELHSTALNNNGGHLATITVPRSPIPTRLTATGTGSASCLEHEHEQVRFVLLDQRCLQPDCPPEARFSADSSVSNSATNNRVLLTATNGANLNLTTYRQMLGNAAATGAALHSLLSHHQQLERLSVVRQQLPLPASDLKLIYSSEHADGYLSLIKMQLTNSKVSSALIYIHVNIKIEGQYIKNQMSKQFSFEINFFHFSFKLCRQLG